MELKPITRQEKIIAGENLTPITRMEKFLKQFGGGGGGNVLDTNGKLLNSVLPEGYPYEAIETVNEPLNITWDGNTDGLVVFDEVLYKISDCVLTKEQLIGATYVLSIGAQETISKDSIADIGIGFGTAYVCVILPNSEGIESGLYFTKTTPEFYVSSFTTTEPVEQSKKVAVPMAEEFLPVTYEEWTFTLEDDSTVTKKVAVFK